ncbi:glycosyltransferase [Alloiococcus otitis]|uniref:glycosyltransferase n=1 Tax=Alloiococcus otitis TaxID=1652 RepID=UPI00235241E2|nr:glycosyltransferase [Alloiococcus otitis]
MKVYLLSDMLKSIEKSGVGRALDHQKMALQKANIPYTTGQEGRVKDYDLIHINTIFPQSLLKAYWARLRGKTVVYHAHSTEEDFRDSFKLANALAPLFKLWLKICYNSGHLIVTPSAYSKSLLDQYQLKAPIQVISNGIDLDYWQASQEEIQAFKARYQADPTRPLIISVGLPIKRKGIIDFVELAKDLPDYDFVWFGHTDIRFLPKEVQQAYYTKLDNLKFAGYIDRKDIRVAYAACDIYLFLTHEETEGIVLLEALASKANTIVRDIPVFNKDFHHGQNVYKGQNLEEFKSLIQDLVQENIPSLTQAGYQAAAAKSIDQVGHQLKLAYQEAMDLADNKPGLLSKKAN